MERWLLVQVGVKGVGNVVQEVFDSFEAAEQAEWASNHDPEKPSWDYSEFIVVWQPADEPSEAQAEWEARNTCGHCDGLGHSREFCSALVW